MKLSTQIQLTQCGQQFSIKITYSLVGYNLQITALHREGVGSAVVVVGQWQRQFYGMEGAMVRAHYRQGK
jgi:hypothetical protein